MVKIKHWSVVRQVEADDFKHLNYPIYYKVWEQPVWDGEQKCLKLCGDVYGHPDHYDMTRVITSAIINVERGGYNTIVTTKSGTKYILDKVDPLYVEWLELKNSTEIALEGSKLLHIPTELNPFRIKGQSND